MGPTIRLLAYFIGAVAAACIMASHADAHRPYFTVIEKISPPGGQPGEMRLLHGDGIFFADPVRVLVLDEEGRAVALSPLTSIQSLVCPEERKCLAVDLEGKRAFELDPATFRISPVRQESDGLRDLEAEEASWGFRTRDASHLEILRGNINLAKELNISLSGQVGCGAVAALLLFGWRWQRKPGHRRIVRTAAAVGIGVARLIGFALVVFVSSYLAALVGASNEIWLTSLLVGGALALLVMWRRRGLRAVRA
jgi:hypothetical protein